MKCMERNKRRMWYAQYIRTDELVDSDGIVTGHRAVYEDPVETRANWSASMGETEVELFGNSEQYDRTIVMDRSMPTLTENTRIWIDRDPKDGPHNYIVKRVADSINGHAYAIKQVDVSA